jgi:hypothetical protein
MTLMKCIYWQISGLRQLDPLSQALQVFLWQSIKNQGKGHGQTTKTENEAKSKVPEEKMKPKHDPSKVKCFNCGKRGPIAPTALKMIKKKRLKVRRNSL